MSNNISEVDINKISSLAYLSVADNKDSPIYQIYKDNKCEITVGQLIDYYQSDQGKIELQQRFGGTIAGTSEYERWNGFLQELKDSNISNYKDWKITNVKSNNGPPNHEDSLKLDAQGYYKDSGFVACVVEVDADTAVVAFRGSEPLGDPQYFNDWQTDFRFSYQEETYQQSDAAQYMKELEAKLGHIDNLYITGHSLGGNLALYATMNIPDELKKKLVSTTTFAAPGFNQDVLDKYGKIIAELTLEGKITEYQNYLDPVGSLLHNVTQAIYIDSTMPEASAFENHSSFLNVVNEDRKTFKRCDVQIKSSLCNMIHDITVLFDKVPYGSKRALVELVLSAWQGMMEPKSTGEKIIGTCLLGIGAINAMTMPVATLVKIIGNALIVAALGEIKYLAEISMEALMNFIERQKEKIVAALELLLEERPAIGVVYNILTGEFNKAWDYLKKWFYKITSTKTESIGNAQKYVKRMEQIGAVMHSSTASKNGVMEVDINKLQELYTKLNKLYSEHRGDVRTIYTMAHNRAKMTKGRYSQYYVDNAATKVIGVSSELESCYNEINKQFALLTSAIQSARKGYISEEKELSRMIRI